MSALEQIRALLPQLSEDEADSLFYDMRGQFEWVGTVFTRGDVESHVGRSLTDPEWEEVIVSFGWRKGIQERMSELAWEDIAFMCEDIGLQAEGAS